MPEFLVTDPSNTVLEIKVFDSDLFSPNGTYHIHVNYNSMIYCTLYMYMHVCTVH